MAQSGSSDSKPGGVTDRDALLREAEKLDAQISRARRSRDDDGTAADVRRHVGDVVRGSQRASGGLRWLYARVLRPLAARGVLGWPLRAYRTLWNRAVFVGTSNGRRRFSKSRATAMLAATAVALRLLPGFLAGCVEFVWDSSRMAISYKTGETWYLGKSQEIDPEGNVFAAQGCESIQCTDQTSIYFRIKPSMAHHLWSLVSNGNIFFPDFVAAGIQNDVNKCTVTGYGSRWKFLVRNWDIYPQILAVNCVPVTEGEIEAQRRTSAAAPD